MQLPAARSALLTLSLLAAAGAPRATAQVKDLQITLLSTNLAERGVGEWGFSVLVEADGRRMLFDTGAHPDTVLENAQVMRIDLSTVGELVISHHHGDHSGGIERLREALKAKSPASLRKLYGAEGMFRPPDLSRVF